MARSGKRRSRKELKNKAMLVVRNITQQEVTNVIFPNGITVGSDYKNFSNGAKIFGDCQVTGILNADKGLHVNGKPFVPGAGFPFLFMDVDSNVFAFDDSSDTSASPASITLAALQVSGSTTLPSSSFQVSGSDGTDLISHLGSHLVSESSTGNCTRTAVLTYNDAAMRAKFPITTKVVHEGLSSTKKISKVEGGSTGPAGPTGASGTTSKTIVATIDFTGAGGTDDDFHHDDETFLLNTKVQPPSGVDYSIGQMTFAMGSQTKLTPYVDSAITTTEDAGESGTGITWPVLQSASNLDAQATTLIVPSGAGSNDNISSITGTITFSGLTTSSSLGKFKMYWTKVGPQSATDLTLVEQQFTINDGLGGTTSAVSFPANGVYTVAASGNNSFPKTLGIGLAFRTVGNTNVTGGTAVISLTFDYTSL